MKKIYFALLVIITVLINSCSKDILKPFEDRIVGTWYISDINRIGIGSSSSEIRFREGTFRFNNDGTLVYTNGQGSEFNGSWDIQKRSIDGNLVRTLQISAVDFTTQMMMSEFYDEMNFRGSDHFVAKINSPFRTYVTHFRR